MKIELVSHNFNSNKIIYQSLLTKAKHFNIVKFCEVIEDIENFKIPLDDIDRENQDSDQLAKKSCLDLYDFLVIFLIKVADLTCNSPHAAIRKALKANMSINNYWNAVILYVKLMNNLTI